MTPDFGENLKRIREKNGWTLEEMAKILGSTKQVLSRYERGERTPKITMASKFAEALGVPLNELTGEDSVTSIHDLVNNAVHAGMIMGENIHAPKTEEARIISGGIDKMPPERREQALKVLQTIFADYFNGGENDET